MKKFLLVSSAAFLTVISVAVAQNYAFSNSLYLGSTGSDVVNLQTWLISHGFSIPAIASGAASKGYFGIQTQNAVEAYQQSVGVAPTGFFGPLTIAKINAGSTVIPNPNPVPNPSPSSVAGAPVINGVTAPTTLSVNQTGTWTVNARDPQNGYIAYSVNWGDSYSCPSGYACNASALATQSFTQTSTFTHSYANAGTYTATFTVRDAAGLTAQTSATVTVTNGGVTTNGPLRVISPNGGETWQIGTTQNIAWTSSYYSGYSGYSNVSTVDIKLISSATYPTCVAGQACPQYVISPQTYTIATNVSASQDYYSWIVGNVGGCNAYGTGTGTYSCPNMPVINAGQYTIQICQSGTANCDSSDNTFTIASNPYYNAPAVNQCPAGYTCTQNSSTMYQTNQCPAGYTCTYNSPTTYSTATQCPAGYTCAQNQYSY